MNRRSAILAACVLLLATAGAQWEPDQRLTNDPASSFLCGQQCIVARGDTLHVVFVDDRTDTFSLYYTRSCDAAASWDSAMRLSPQADGNVFQATVAASGDFVHVVWEVAGNQAMKYRRSTDAGASWLVEETLVVSSRSCGGPFLAAEGQNVGLVWSDSRDGNWNGELYYKQSGDGGSNWTADTRLTVDTDSVLDKEACLVMSGSNRYLVWTRVGWNTSVNSVWFMRSTNGGAGWEPRVKITNDTTSQSQPMLAVVGSNVHVAWLDGRDPAFGIYYRRSTDNGSSWNSERCLTNQTYGADYPAVAAAGGNVHLVYRAWPSGQFVIYYQASNDNGQTWTPETVLTTVAGMGTANMAATGSRAHLLLYDNREGNFEIYHKRNLTAGGILETPAAGVRVTCYASIVRGTLNMGLGLTARGLRPELLDATGRKVLDLHPGPNDVSRLAPGVYFVKEYSAFSTQHSELSAVRKVVRAE